MSQARRRLTPSIDRNIWDMMNKALRITVETPSAGLFFYRVLSHQHRAGQIRRQWARQGIEVPPVAIVTVTGRCNLACKGCYATALDRPREQELDAHRLRQLIAEADELGVSVIILTGGEPLMRPELLDITRDHPRVLFPLFTNASLLDDHNLARLASQHHVVPLMSLEGDRRATETRRGPGSYDRVLVAMNKLKRAGNLFGTSVMVTRANYDLVTSDYFVKPLLDAGCTAFVYVVYQPIGGADETMILTDGQRIRLPEIIRNLGARHPGIFLAFPDESEAQGNCLAAGKGLLHISPSGRLEPCPFTPVSDASLTEMSLAEGLRSPLFRAVREGSGDLRGTPGHCVLWENRDWVASLLEARLPEHADEQAEIAGEMPVPQA